VSISQLLIVQGLTKAFFLTMNRGHENPIGFQVVEKNVTWVQGKSPKDFYGLFKQNHEDYK
jgi:hypothetical protein